MSPIIFPPHLFPGLSDCLHVSRCMQVSAQCAVLSCRTFGSRNQAEASEGGWSSGWTSPLHAHFSHKMSSLLANGSINYQAITVMLASGGFSCFLMWVRTIPSIRESPILRPAPNQSWPRLPYSSPWATTCFPGTLLTPGWWVQVEWGQAPPRRSKLNIFLYPLKPNKVNIVLFDCVKEK